MKIVTNAPVLQNKGTLSGISPHVASRKAGNQTRLESKSEGEDFEKIFKRSSKPVIMLRLRCGRGSNGVWIPEKEPELRFTASSRCWKSDQRADLIRRSCLIPVSSSHGASKLHFFFTIDKALELAAAKSSGLWLIKRRSIPFTS